MAAPQTTDVNAEWKIITIGRGSFASISVLTGRPIAFKHVIIPAKEKIQELLREFETLCFIYETCNKDSFFAIPRPFAFYDPANRASFRAVNRPLGPHLRRGTHMDKARDPSLCRIYFGKVISEVGRGGRPNLFLNSANFPLDVARYRKILENDRAGEYPSVEEIVYGMGEMLGRLHWLAGNDGRDIEFVLGGIAFIVLHMLACVSLIPSVQVRSWEKTPKDVPMLVEAFFINDPYYPRPIPGNPLYAEFKRGYLSVFPTAFPLAIQLANAFLHAIEVEQAKRADK
ncbi:hypothetical protein PISMIDRAFT_96188 [Pisolithus microcarpus 441]|uniref:DUF3669 domain-containing protein n=1 Tax=Pisolithus microcarpus 441 TaxID=765257 RepID=A0A0C9Z976_9AGAM|nr:hypothetical protein PISMIDRAFT_96188 [Pisolithus microcarpus 441]